MKPQPRVNRLRVFEFLLVAVVVGLVIVAVISAAGTPTAFEAETGTLAGSASVETVSGASGGSGVKFAAAATPTPTPTPTGVPAACANGGAYLWANLEACGWPGPTNTGPDLTQCPGGALTAYTGSKTITTAGTTVSCKTITGGLNIAAQNVTIVNSKVSFNGGGAGGSGVININDGGSATIDHVETDGLNRTHACIWNEGVKGPTLQYSMVAKYVNCHGVNDGIFSWWWSSDKNLGAGSDFIIQDTYLYDFTENAANGHIDGYQTEGAMNGLIQHNTFRVQRVAGDVTVSGGGLNSAVALWNDWNGAASGKSTTNITVDNNLMTSGGFTIYAEDYSPAEGGSAAVGGNTLTNVHFTNNRFSTIQGACVGDYGVWFYRSGWSPYFGGPTDGWNTGGSTRTGNKILETGFNLDNGNPNGCG